MELPNHLLPWDTVKKLLKGAWDEGHNAGKTDALEAMAWTTGDDEPTDTTNPYQEDA